MKKIRNNRSGVSMISLVISIIVIIILSLIVTSPGADQVDQATFASFASEISGFGEEIRREFVDKKADYAIKGKSLSRSALYYAVATGEEIATSSESVPTGVTGAMSIEVSPKAFTGEEFFEITSEEQLENLETSEKDRYSGQTFYTTDAGEVFMMPGLYREEDGETRWWINEGKYYVSEKGVNTPISVSGLANKVQVGDYIRYKPDIATYTTNAKNTGTIPVRLESDSGDLWQVLSIKNGIVNITPAGRAVNVDEVKLEGIKGYRRGAEELNNICAALYSNTKLRTTARSMTVEDVNEASIYEPAAPKKYAYYPSNATEEEMAGVKEGYEAKKSGTTKFYTYDEGGVTNGTGDEDCRKPATGNPVYMTETWYTYQPISDIGKILGGTAGWLASPCVYL